MKKTIAYQIMWDDGDDGADHKHCEECERAVIHEWRKATFVLGAPMWDEEKGRWDEGTWCWGHEGFVSLIKFTLDRDLADEGPYPEFDIEPTVLFRALCSCTEFCWHRKVMREYLKEEHYDATPELKAWVEDPLLMEYDDELEKFIKGD